MRVISVYNVDSVKYLSQKLLIIFQAFTFQIKIPLKLRIAFLIQHLDCITDQVN